MKILRIVFTLVKPMSLGVSLRFELLMERHSAFCWRIIDNFSDEEIEKYQVHKDSNANKSFQQAQIKTFFDRILWFQNLSERGARSLELLKIYEPWL